FGPALAALGGTLFILHTGLDDHLYARSSKDGRAFTGTVNLNERSKNGPSVTVLSGRLLVGWTGTDKRLNFMELDPRSLSRWHKTTLGETSADGVWVLGFGFDFLFSWRGSGNEHLNYAIIPECDLAKMLVTGDGSVTRKATLDDRSEIGPT